MFKLFDNIKTKALLYRRKGKSSNLATKERENMSKKEKLIQTLEEKGDKTFLKSLKIDVCLKCVNDLKTINEKLSSEKDLKVLNLVSEKLEEVKKLLGGF